MNDNVPLFQEARELRQERDEARRKMDMFKDALEFYTSTESEVGEILSDNAHLAAQVGALREACAILMRFVRIKELAKGADVPSEVKYALAALDLTPPPRLPIWRHGYREKSNNASRRP